MTRVGAIRRHPHLFHHLRTTHVRPGKPHALGEIADGLSVPRRRQRVNHVTRHDLGSSGTLHVDDRGFTRNGNRFFDSTNRHRAILGLGKVRRYLNPFSNKGRESREGHRYGIRASRKTDDGVPARAIGHRNAASFNQQWAGCFHSDAW